MRRVVPRRVLTFIVVALLLTVCVARARAAAVDTYCNPIDVLLADPFIFHEGDTYYLYGTAAYDGLLVWTSKNLVDWQLRGHAFTRTRQTWSRHSFWAPELFAHKGKYYLHFTAVGRDNARRIVLAEADSPLGPFRESKAPWFDPKQETIDSDVFRDDDGSLYLYSVYIDTPTVRHFQLTVRKLDDRLNVLGDSVLCMEPSEKWEGGWVNEGPFVMKHDGVYVLTYSGVGYKSADYSVGIAWAKSPLGPWTKSKKGPILHQIPKVVSGPGHHCFIESPDGKELFIAYHTHQFIGQPGPPRQLAIDRVTWVNDGPYPMMKVAGPTTRPQPMPSGSAPLVRGKDDEFNTNQLDRRQWDVFSEDPRSWSINEGRLVIKMFDGDVYEDRSDLSNLFLERAPDGDFDVVTRVAVKPEKDFEQAFLALWQNHNQFVKVAVLHSHGGLKYEIGVEDHMKYDSTLFDANENVKDYGLKIGKRGDQYEFSINTDSSPWRSLGKRSIELVNIRAGLGACSPQSARDIPAAFDFVHFAAQNHGEAKTTTTSGEKR